MSSGFPLEHEVASTLRSLGFHINGEFPYTRYGSSEVSDCSIDLVCHAYLPLEDKGTYKARLIVPIECKYRVLSKSWLFMVDMNEDDFSPSQPAGLREFSCFTAYDYDEKPIIDYCCSMPAALKATEINIETGETHDTDIKHALNQLRYALPSILHREVFFNGACHPVDSYPFFILPLLVTNAPLRMTKESLSISTVSAVQSLNEISEAVDCVDLFSDHSDSFDEHCARIFRNFMAITTTKTDLRTYDAVQEVLGDSLPQYRSARKALQSLSFGGSLDFQRNMFRQFWVCNLKSLGTIILQAVAAINESMSNGKILSEVLRTYGQQSPDKCK